MKFTGLLLAKGLGGLKAGDKILAHRPCGTRPKGSLIKPPSKTGLVRRQEPAAGGMLVLLVFAASLLAVLSVGAAAPAHAQATAPPQSGSTVTAGILLADVDQINLVSGTFNGDFYLWFNSTGNPQTVHYELVNGQATTVTVESNTSTYQEYRISGTFENTLDFADFPFGNHSLSIDVESKNLQASQLTFVPDSANSGTDSLSLNGWDLLGYSISAAPHSYSASETYSRLTFTFTIGAPASEAFLKDVLPVVLITLIAMLAFGLPPARSFERVFIGVTTLIAAVQFHIALLGQIPAVDYLTLADDMMLTAYTLILYGLAVTVLLARQVDRKEVDRAWRLNKKGAVLVPVVAAMALAFLLLLRYSAGM
jgi:hypothetical protein